jgi:mannose/fructose/N-acetylgalactosamine-specific phosphotransferase system component IIB
MATPSDINLSILTIEEAAKNIKNRFFDNENVMLLFKSPEDVYKLLKSGGRIGEINVGGMHFAKDKIQLFDAIFVDNYDVEMFEKIKQLNVGLEVRMVPTDSKKDIFKAIEEKFYNKMKDKGQKSDGN